jgi:hypothetical protein
MKKDKTIDEIILKHSDRGMDKLVAKHPKEYCKIAVQNFLELKLGVVFLYTGFYVKGFPETDGPLGTYFLALALEKIGHTPIIITDEYCQDYFRDIKTLYIPLDGLENDIYQNILNDFKPVCHISIERLGADEEGKYLNSRGVDIEKFTAPLDELFTLGSKKTPTFAIGDGGNEIGMGNFRDFLKEVLYVSPNATISDFPIIASVSNWGAYGFIAYMQKFLKKELLPAFEDVEEYMDYILRLGCVDGIKCENTKSVDGKEWYIEEEILKELRTITNL